MVTRRDLVEADADLRRRLVAAWLSGTSGDKTEPPVGAGRALSFGLAVTVLLLLGALVSRLVAAWS